MLTTPTDFHPRICVSTQPTLPKIRGWWWLAHAYRCILACKILSSALSPPPPTTNPHPFVGTYTQLFATLYTYLSEST